MSNSQWQPRQQEPAWIDGRTAETAVREREFIRSVYTWMFMGLALTAGIALLVLKSAALQQVVFGNRMIMWGLLIAEFALVMYLQVRILRMSAATAAGMFLFYSALNGLTFSVIFLVYEVGSIANAFFTASAMFAGMSVYGYVTKRDLTSWGTYLVMATWGIVIALLLNTFLLKSSALEMGISIIGVLVFTGLTAYDTQRLKSFANAPQQRDNLAVYGALMLYLDFINLFLMLLRLFGNRRN
jgi:FtsH-binding integral membrane protein